MKTRAMFGLSLLLLSSCTAMPAAKLATFDVRKYGAIGSGTAKDTPAFQKALDACGAAGGGEVVVPAGTYLIGSIIVPSNTTLRFEKDAILNGSPDADDYPLMTVRWEGRWKDGHRALISMVDAKNVAVVGPGKINGDMQIGFLRNPRGPSMIEPIRCTNVRLEDFSIHYRRMWNIHLTECQGVTAKNLTIRSERDNGDGIDIDSTRDVRIDHCDIDAGDDAIVLKSGRGIEGVKNAKPTEHIEVYDCKLGSSFAGLAVGTEMSGGVRGLVARRCTFTRGANAIYIKSRTGRGGFIDDIDCSDLTADGPKVFLNIDLMNKGIQDEQPVPGIDGIPEAGNFRFSNCKSSCDTFLEGIWIAPEKPLKGLSVVNASGTCRKPISLANVRDVVLREIHLTGFTGPMIKIHDVTGAGLEEAVQVPAPVRPATRASRGTQPAPASQP